MTARDAAYVAREINKPANWVRRNAARLPHHRAGRTYYWTDEDIVAIHRELQVRPSGQPVEGDVDLRPITGQRRAS